MKHIQKGKEGSMAVKVDLSKAYDRVKWNYLRLVMDTMRFGGRWIDLVMQCEISVNYSILINGNTGDVIYPTRGLRQGDPYLFLLCAKGLSALINCAERQGKITWVCS